MPVYSDVVGNAWRTPAISDVVGVSWNTYDEVTVLLSNPSATVNENTGEAILEVESNIASGTLYVAWYAGSQTAKTPADIVAGTGAIDFTNAPADFSNQFTVPFQSWDADYFAAFTQEIPDAGFSQVFYASVQDWTFTRTSEATVVDFEGNIKELPNDAAAHPGARVVVNSIISQDLGDISWLVKPTITLNENTTDVTDPDGGNSAWKAVYDGSGGSTVHIATAGGVYPIFDAGTEFIPSVWLRLSTGANNFYLTDNTGGAKVCAVTDQWKRFAMQAATATGSSLTSLSFLRPVADFGAYTAYIWHPMLEVVTGQTNQNPSEFVTDVQSFDYENGNTVDANGVVTELAGIALPTTDEPTRHENNLLFAPSFAGWGKIETGTATASITDGIMTASNPNGDGRAFLGVTVNVVAGRHYNFSFRATQISGNYDCNQMNSMFTGTLPVVGLNKLNFNADGLWELYFVAVATAAATLRAGIGCQSTESHPCVWEMSEPVFRDVTDSINYVACTEVVDGQQTYATTNENTVINNLVTENPGAAITENRAYNSGVIFGDSFTDGNTDLGSYINGLEPKVIISRTGTAFAPLADITTLVTGHSFSATDNFALLEGGINNIISDTPIADMKAEKLAQVAHVESLGMRYLVYNIAPFSTVAPSWTAGRQAVLEEFNDWLDATFPGKVIDMYTALGDPNDATAMDPALTVDGGLHPNAAGYLAVDEATVPFLSPPWLEGVLLEGEATNYIKSPTDFAAASWAKVSSPLGGKIAAPDGSEAGQLVAVNDPATKRIYQSVTSGLGASAKLETTLWAKQAPGSTSGIIRVSNPQTSSLGRWLVDVSLLSSTEWSMLHHSHPAVNEEFPFFSTAGGAAGVGFDNNYNGSTEISFYLWGVNQVPGGFTSSTILGGDSATTRAVTSQVRTLASMGLPDITSAATVTLTTRLQFDSSIAGYNKLLTVGTVTNGLQIFVNGTTVGVKKYVASAEVSSTTATYAYTKGELLTIVVTHAGTGTTIDCNGATGSQANGAALAVAATTVTLEPAFQVVQGVDIV